MQERTERKKNPVAKSNATLSDILSTQMSSNLWSIFLQCQIHKEMVLKTLQVELYWGDQDDQWHITKYKAVMMT